MNTRKGSFTNSQRLEIEHNLCVALTNAMKKVNMSEREAEDFIKLMKSSGSTEKMLINLLTGFRKSEQPAEKSAA